MPPEKLRSSQKKFVMTIDPFQVFRESYLHQLNELQANNELIQEENVRRAIDLIVSCRGKLALTGMGKSGLIAQKLAATFSSTGTPAFFLHPGESLHGDLGVLQKEDMVLLLAKSGESDEVIRMLQVIQKMELPVISILGNPDSTVGRMSTVIIRATVSREADPLNLAPTASTTVSLVVGDALASAVAELRGFKPEHFALYHPAGQLGKRLLLSVSDLISDQVPTVHEGATMAELLEQETSANLGGVMVVDDSGGLVGLVTDGDIRRAIMKFGNVLECAIERIMTRGPISVAPDTRAIEALRLMENRPSQISVLPVADADGRPVGLLRLHDLVRAGL